MLEEGAPERSGGCYAACVVVPARQTQTLRYSQEAATAMQSTAVRSRFIANQIFRYIQQHKTRSIGGAPQKRARGGRAQSGRVGRVFIHYAAALCGSAVSRRAATTFGRTCSRFSSLFEGSFINKQQKRRITFASPTSQRNDAGHHATSHASVLLRLLLECLA